MNQTVSSTDGRLSRMRRYRRLMFGSIIGGVAISLVLRFLNYLLLGEVVYLIGFAAFLAIWQGTSITVIDEHEKDIERSASTVTLTAFGIIFAASGTRSFHAVTGSTISA